MGRYQACIDLHLILRDEHGWVFRRAPQPRLADGQLGLPSGHFEDGDFATAGVAREAEEGIGVLVKTDDLRLTHVMHQQLNVTQPEYEVDSQGVEIRASSRM